MPTCPKCGKSEYWNLWKSTDEHMVCAGCLYTGPADIEQGKPRCVCGAELFEHETDKGVSLLCCPHDGAAWIKGKPESAALGSQGNSSAQGEAGE